MLICEYDKPSQRCIFDETPTHEGNIAEDLEPDGLKRKQGGKIHVFTDC